MAGLRVVLKDKNFFFLWLGQIISQFGDRLNQMALIALIYARAPGSTVQLAKILSFTVAPVFLIGPLACSYVDRWNHRRTMITCDLLRAGLVMLLVFFLIKCKSNWPVYIVIFAIFSAGRFFIPAKLAIIPELVSAEKLLLANSLSSTTGMLAVVGGYGLGGLIVEHVGPYGGFFIDALTYLISGCCIFIIAPKMHVAPKGEGVSFRRALDEEKKAVRTIFADIGQGWKYILKDKSVRFIAQTFFLLWSAVGAVYVVIIVFVQKTLGTITRDLGMLAVFLGLGLFLGAVLYGRFGGKICKMRVIFISLGLSGLALCLFVFFLKVFSSAVIAMLLSFLWGLTLSPIMVGAQTLIHEVTAQKLRGRVFGSLEIVAHFAFLLFMLVSAVLAERIGRFGVLLAVGVILTAAGFGAVLFKVDKRYNCVGSN